MSAPPERAARFDLAQRPHVVQWLLLAVLTAALIAVLLALRLPAALLLGLMFAVIVLGTQGAAVRVPKKVYTAAQALIRGLIAIASEPAIAQTFLKHWRWFLAGVTSKLRALPEPRPSGARRRRWY